MTEEGRVFARADARAASLEDLRAAGLLPQQRSLARALLVSRGDPRRYPLGLWMWGINRLTGLVVLLYIVVHVLTLLFADGFYKTGFFGGVIVLTVGAVAFHAVNGTRLVLGDLGVLTSLRQHRLASYVVVVLAVLAMVGTLARVARGLP